MTERNTQLSNLERAIGRIESKLDRALTDTADHEDRIKKVEGRLHWFSGAGAVMGVLAGYFTKSHA